MRRYRGLALLLTAAIVLVVVGDRTPAQNKKDGEKGPPEPACKEIRIPMVGYAFEVVFSPDGTKMAVGAAANIAVWNVADGQEITRMHLPSKQNYHRMIFSADSKTLIWNGREDPIVRLFDVKTGKQVREFPQHDPRKEWREAMREQAERIGKGDAYGFSSGFCCYAPGGAHMAFNRTGPKGDGYGLTIVDIATAKIVRTIEDPYWLGYSVYSPDGKHIAVHESDKGVRIYDAGTAKLVQTLADPDPRFKGSGFDYISFSPDGALLAAWGRGSATTLDVWDLKAGRRVCTAPIGGSVRFSRDNKSLLLLKNNGVALHNLLMDKTVHLFTPNQRSYPTFAAFGPDEKKLIIIAPSNGTQESWQYSLYIYDLPAHFLDPPAARIDDAEMSKLWPMLAGDNQFRLDLAIKAFRNAPKEAVAVFRKELRPMPKERQKEVEAWIALLDDDDYRRRDAAMADLQKAAHEFAPLLESRRKLADPGETRNRLHFVLKQMNNEKTPMPLVRESRVITLLVQLDTPEARALLTDLAAGAADARTTAEARGALERLQKQSR